MLNRLPVITMPVPLTVQWQYFTWLRPSPQLSVYSDSDHFIKSIYVDNIKKILKMQ